MRLNGEVSHKEEEEGEKENGNLLPQKVVVVGYALTSKKKKSFMQPKFEVLARKKGIVFIAIDLNKPLSDQGPFDVVLHKMSGKEWCEVIEDYKQNIQKSLSSILQMQYDIYTIGSQCSRMWQILTCPTAMARFVSQGKCRSKLPLVAKPLVVDGTAKSHELFLAYDRFSLSNLNLPWSYKSLSIMEVFSLKFIFFPRVSSATASADDADLDPGIAELPPQPLLERLSRELRSRLGLQLFNIDMIREHGTRDVFYIQSSKFLRVLGMETDVGYGKMPGYEHIFTDFLLNLAPAT
ncbi:hypothetical protein LWI29_021487 [Acer saccharum]|uniref:Inositol-tetrakisphosphate 1-kinase n=1 Tax=Acer saccharum TaxID=4024 RepID=A0AA39VIR6_ACESA|nr:hypothetical protein LWI29_021487 [Acer saccharum]